MANSTTELELNPLPGASDDDDTTLTTQETQTCEHECTCAICGESPWSALTPPSLQTQTLPEPASNNTTELVASKNLKGIVNTAWTIVKGLIKTLFCIGTLAIACIALLPSWYSSVKDFRDDCRSQNQTLGTISQSCKDVLNQSLSPPPVALDWFSRPSGNSAIARRAQSSIQFRDNQGAPRLMQSLRLLIFLSNESSVQIFIALYMSMIGLLTVIYLGYYMLYLVRNHLRRVESDFQLRNPWVGVETLRNGPQSQVMILPKGLRKRHHATMVSANGDNGDWELANSSAMELKRIETESADGSADLPLTTFSSTESNMETEAADSFEHLEYADGEHLKVWWTQKLDFDAGPCSTSCSDQDLSFLGMPGFYLYISQRHNLLSRAWVCCDCSEDHSFLTDCESCSSGTVYGCRHKAANHLRNVHFKSNGNDSPLSLKLLQRWMLCITENNASQLEDVHGKSLIANALEVLSQSAVNKASIAEQQTSSVEDESSNRIAEQRVNPAENPQFRKDSCTEETMELFGDSLSLVFDTKPLRKKLRRMLRDTHFAIKSEPLISEAIMDMQMLITVETENMRRSKISPTTVGLAFERVRAKALQIQETMVIAKQIWHTSLRSMGKPMYLYSKPTGDQLQVLRLKAAHCWAVASQKEDEAEPTR